MQILVAAMLFPVFAAVADPGSGDPLVDWLKNNASAVGILAFMVVALMRGWLVTGREANQLRADLERAMDLVFKQAEVARGAISAGATIAERKEP